VSFRGGEWLACTLILSLRNVNMNPMRSSNRDIEDFGSSPSHARRETSSGPSLWNYVTAVLVIVVVVTIPILFVMVSNVKTDSKNVSVPQISHMQ